MTARDLRRGCALLLAFLAYLTLAGALTNLVAPENLPATPTPSAWTPRSIPTAADRSRPLPGVGAPEARASRVGIDTREPSLHWTALAACESSNDPRAVSPSGRYRGAFQMDADFWRTYGGLGYASRPDLASYAEQLAVAQNGYAARGAQPWPVCGRLL